MIQLLRYPFLLLALLSLGRATELQKVNGCNQDDAYTLNRDMSIARYAIKRGADYYGSYKDDHTGTYYYQFMDRSNLKPDTLGLSKYYSDFYDYFWPGVTAVRRRGPDAPPVTVSINGVCNNKHPVCSTPRPVDADITVDNGVRTVTITACDKYFDDKQWHEEDCHTKYVSDLATYKAEAILHALMVAPGPFGGMTEVACGEQDCYNLAAGTLKSTARDKNNKPICNGNCDPKLAQSNADTKALLALIAYAKLNCNLDKLFVKAECQGPRVRSKDECNKSCAAGCSSVRVSVDNAMGILRSRQHDVDAMEPMTTVWECDC